MSLIFTAFANSRKEPLPSLQEENEAIYKILSNEVKTEGWHIHNESFATTDSVCDYLLIHQETVTLFMFSGHAERDKLYMENDEANAKGIAELLGNCPNLKVVVLNGCSTQGQVQGLLDKGIPIVIATSAPVGDKAAARFSISFFQSLCRKNKTIVNAFNDGLATAKTVSKTSIKLSRSLDWVEVETKENQTPAPLWGIFHQPHQDWLLDWKLIVSEQEVPTDFIPNELLLEKTWEAIAPYVATEQQRLRMSKNDKIDKIITELPHPISEFIRKLVAKPKPGEEDETFYHDLNANRLKYLIYTYTTSIELLTFTLLAQLWDEHTHRNIPVFTEDLKAELQRLFDLDIRARQTYSFIPLIQKMKASLLQQDIEPFVTEYLQISTEFNAGTDFHEACMYLEEVRNEVMNQNNSDANWVRKTCIKAEKQLAKVLERLGFLAKYRMSSMKDINFIKYKHQTSPKYRLNFVDLKYRPSGMDIETETMPDSMDNSSIVIVKHTAQGLSYLNLSPFIFDENSFDDKAKLANLVVFQSYEKQAGVFTFRHIYRPLSRPLILRQKIEYFNLIANQFDAFHQIVFGTNLTAHA